MTKKDRARKWVNGYSVAGAAIVIAAVVPGTSSAALVTIEIQMCYKIGKIYRGDDYKWEEADAVASVVGLAAVVGKLAALEALNLVPLAGQVAKASIAVGIIKGLGEAIIAFYEQTDM